MAKVNIYTTLSTVPRSKCHCCRTTKKLYSMTRGATATFILDFTSKSYTFETISQIMFLFKQGRTTHQFNAINYLEDGSWELNKTSDYEFTLSEDQQTLTLKLGKNVTKLFKSTENSGNYATFEIVVQIDEITNSIESRADINVKDSIYGSILSDTAVYCGEDTICSDDTICNG